MGPFASILAGTTPTDDHQSVLDVIQVVTVIHANWWYLIQNYAMPQSLNIVPWCVITLVLSSAVLTHIVPAGAWVYVRRDARLFHD